VRDGNFNAVLRKINIDNYRTVEFEWEA